MIQDWMVYTFGVTLLFAWAAWALEEIAVSRGLPARVIWIAAVVGSLLLPQAIHLRPRTGPSVSISIRGVAMPWDRDGRNASISPARETPEGSVAGGDLEREVRILWGASSALVLAALIASAALVARRRRHWTLQVMQRRRIWVSAETGPAVFGFFPGEIVLPEWILSSPPADRRLAVTHEEEHIRSRDPQLVFGIALLCAAMPWNLPLWWIASRLRRAIELDCDRRLVNCGFNRRSYSRLLIEVTERGLPHYMAVTGMSGSSSFLEKRIRLLLGRKKQSPVRAGALAMAASFVLLAAYSIDPPAGLAEERETALDELRSLNLGEAIEVFEVAASAMQIADETSRSPDASLPRLDSAPAELRVSEPGEDMLLLAPTIGFTGAPTSDPASVRVSSPPITLREPETRVASYFPARLAGEQDFRLCGVADGQLRVITSSFQTPTGDALLGSHRLDEVYLARFPNTYGRGSAWFEEKGTCRVQ